LSACRRRRLVKAREGAATATIRNRIRTVTETRLYRSLFALGFIATDLYGR
jgi:hypothetical protein